MRILIFGSTGMVGRHLMSRTDLTSTREVVAPTRREVDLLDKDQVFQYVSERRPDMVVHLAGLVGGIRANRDLPADFLSENAYMALHVIMAARESHVPRLLYVGSSCMYPATAPNPLREEYVLQGPLEPANEGYALAKVVGAKLCEYVSRHGGYAYRVVIPTNLYGPHDRFDPYRSHLVAAAIRKLYAAKVNGDSVVSIWGDGSARREFMYVKDFADFLVRAIDRFEALPQYLNVGLGFDHTVTEYYEAAARVVGYGGSFSYDRTKPAGVKERRLSVDRLREFGWSAHTSLEDGLKETYEYFLRAEEAGSS